ncbi:MAG TPA: glycoside hydrolase domain-containing protein [Phycisphaerae bacterium]|nr:glycoside hydrolase domain-containing protein [Phycisphaerae bacterium]
MRFLAALFVVVLTCTMQVAAAEKAALFDELAVLFSDSKSETGMERVAADSPRGVPAGIHVLVDGLPSGATVRWRLALNGELVAEARVFRLIDVPVEQNTGLESRTEAFDGKENPYVIRRAPFRVFEALAPVAETAEANDAGMLALRVEVPIAPNAQAGLRAYEIALESGNWRQTLHWDLTVHLVTVRPTGPQSPGYTNWFSPDIIAQRHGLERWSEPFWEMLGRYADLMARGRQNTFWIRWPDFVSVGGDGKVTLNRQRLQRYVKTFLDRGFTRIESGHLASRHADDWDSPRLDLTWTGSDVMSEKGRSELETILPEIRAALNDLGVPEKIPFLQHLTDEPNDANSESYKTLAEQVRRLIPGVKIFEATMSLKLVGAVNQWCPQVQEYQRNRDFFEARKKAGDGVWVYACLMPGGPWINRLLDQERLRPLYVGWALTKYDLAGFLHWGLNHYSSAVDPLAQSVIPWGKGPPDFLPAGDSHVIYPGKDGPLSGQRFEAQRIGMEDAELLRVLKLRDPEKAQAIISRVFRAFDDYEKDTVAYRAARRDLLKALTPEAAFVCFFDQPEDASLFTVTVRGEKLRPEAKPKIEDKKLYLMESWCKSAMSAAFTAPTKAATRVVEASWKLIMNTGAEGAGFAWLNVEKHDESGAAPEVEQWEAPGIPASFAVGFDALDPPNRDPFRGSGNVYDRPQHEVSLHWDGMEIVKRTTPMEFRDEKPHDVRLRIEFVPGGADVGLWIDGTAIYERYFIPGMTAYVGRPAFGGRNGETAGDVLIDDLSVECFEPLSPPEPPVSVMAVDHQLNDVNHPKNEATVEFPDQTDRFARIICTLQLDKPETRFDPWDRIATIGAYADDGERFEILRYITPYHRGHEWKMDVTDFRPLLRGKRKIEQNCGTQGEGWVVTVKFDFYPGPTDRLAYKVVNLWNGSPEIGNPDKPVEDFYRPRTIALDGQTAFAKVRTVVTGHGMEPNTNNAGEFMPLGRTLVINGESFRNVLWKTDNYLNPCRPQGGTWKYDRAGWGPGDVVRPWEVDATPLVKAGGELKIEYRLDPYVNEGRGKTWAPTHVTEGQLILYSKPQAPKAGSVNQAGR